jgi:hypothetical protein
MFTFFLTQFRKGHFMFNHRRSKQENICHLVLNLGLVGTEEVQSRGLENLDVELVGQVQVVQAVHRSHLQVKQNAN